MLLGAALFALLPITAHPASPAEQEFQSVARLAPDVAHGRELFEACAACHGETGAGASDGTVPAIGGQHFHVIVWSLVGFRHGRRLDPRMQHFSDPQHLSSTRDIADVAAYASGLPPTWHAVTGDGFDTTRGAATYRDACASCHGAKAQGDDQKRSPRLAGQHYEYLLKRLQEGTENRHSSLAHDHSRGLESLGSADLLEVCNYLSHLGP
jgi:cytochrome c553